MPATIRLMRTGKKGHANYRIVVVDKRKKRNGLYKDLIGTYNPLTNPPTLKFDSDRLALWIQKGAVLSEGARKLKFHSKKG